MTIGLARKDSSKSNEFGSYHIAFEQGAWETEHRTGWAKEKKLKKKRKNIFACILAMVKNVVALFYYVFYYSLLVEYIKKRDRPL